MGETRTLDAQIYQDVGDDDDLATTVLAERAGALLEDLASPPPAPAGAGISEAEIAELERLCAEATPEPWEFCPGEDNVVGGADLDAGLVHGSVRGRTAEGSRYHIARVWGDAAYPEADASLIAAARNALPRLLAELRRLRALSAPTARVGGDYPSPEAGSIPGGPWPWLAHAIDCCDAWEPEVRIIGNVPAKALGDMLRALAAPPAPAAERTALAALVALKEHKDAHGKDAEYLRRHPLAWEAARRALVNGAVQPSRGRLEALVGMWEVIANNDTPRTALALDRRTLEVCARDLRAALGEGAATGEAGERTIGRDERCPKCGETPAAAAARWRKIIDSDANFDAEAYPTPCDHRVPSPAPRDEEPDHG